METSKHTYRNIVDDKDNQYIFEIVEDTMPFLLDEINRSGVVSLVNKLEKGDAITDRNGNLQPEPGYYTYQWIIYELRYRAYDKLQELKEQGINGNVTTKLAGESCKISYAANQLEQLYQLTQWASDNEILDHENDATRTVILYIFGQTLAKEVGMSLIYRAT